MLLFVSHGTETVRELSFTPRFIHWSLEQTLDLLLLGIDQSASPPSEYPFTTMRSRQGENRR